MTARKWIFAKSEFRSWILSADREHFKMKGMLDITDHNALEKLLADLRPDTQPAFGVLDAQGMVEHLITSVAYTNGKFRTELEADPEIAKMRKQQFIYSDIKMPKGLTTPGDDSQTGHSCLSLESAITKLLRELREFDLHFAANPGITEMHPGMGAFNYGEWVIFHNKHFTHHLEQFGLL